MEHRSSRHWDSGAPEDGGHPEPKHQGPGGTGDGRAATPAPAIMLESLILRNFLPD